MFSFQKHFVLVWKHGTFFWISLNHCPLTNRYLIIQKLDLQFSLVESSCENITLTEILSCLKVAKKHAHVYCFHGKHFTCWDLRGMLETDNFVQKDSKQTLHTMLTNEFHAGAFPDVSCG